MTDSAYVRGPRAGRLERAESLSHSLTGSLTEGVKGRPNGGVAGAVPATPSGGCALDAGSARPLTVSGAAGEKVWPGAFPGLTFSPADASPARGFPFAAGNAPDHEITPTRATLRGAGGRLRPACPGTSGTSERAESSSGVHGEESSFQEVARSAVSEGKLSGRNFLTRSRTTPERVAAVCLAALLGASLTACTTIAPLVRCVPDSQLHPCPEARP